MGLRTSPCDPTIRLRADFRGTCIGKFVVLFVCVHLLVLDRETKPRVSTPTREMLQVAHNPPFASGE